MADTDLSDRLEIAAQWDDSPSALLNEAATALAEKDAQYERLASRMDAMAADNQRLRAECEGLRAAIHRANRTMPNISTDCMGGDNLAIVLCSAFDDGDKETEDDTGWSEAARNGYEEVIEAIRLHYCAALSQKETGNAA